MPNIIKNRKIFTSSPFDLESDGGGVSLVTNDDKIKSLVAGTNIVITDNGDSVTIDTTAQDEILIVDNYSALPDPTTVSGQFYWVSNSQGTQWLPGSLGGTYYNSGLYYSNGVNWEYIETPYQATLAETITGTNNDKFITPSTLNGWWNNIKTNTIQVISQIWEFPALDLTITTSPAYKRGRIWYNTNDEALSVYDDISGTSVELGQEVIIRARNNTGSTILNGSAVYISGALGQNPTMALAIANIEATSLLIGLATHDIPNNTVGKITIIGLVKDLNTSSFSDGDALFLSTTVSGQLTNIAPSTPNYSVPVGFVAHSHVTQGKILVRTEMPLATNTSLGTSNRVAPSQNAVKTITDTKITKVVSTDKAITRFNGISGDVQNSNIILNNEGSITFPGVAAPSYTQGKLIYDVDNECLTFYNNDSNVALQIGQEAWIRVRNDSGASIANGSAVYISGTHASGIPQISLAQANAVATTIVAGLATETIANNAIGYVTSIGLVRGLNTSGFAAGATVFLSATTPGALTTTVPTSPNYRFRVGIVTRSNVSNGTIHVTPSTGAVGNGTAGQVLGINGSGNQAFLNASEIVGYQGYVITAKMGTSNTLNPADASTYYWGGPLTNAFQSTPAVRRLYFPKAGTIKAATLFSTQSAGSNEQSTISIRLNNTSDTSISTTATFATSVTVLTNTALNIPVVVGDYIEIKWVTPTWVTNPTNMVIDSQIYIE